MFPESITVENTVTKGTTPFPLANSEGGSPYHASIDLLQIDGLGGSRLVTSKIAIIGRSSRPDADIEYTFSQVDIERDRIGYDGDAPAEATTAQKLLVGKWLTERQAWDSVRAISKMFDVA